MSDSTEQRTDPSEGSGTKHFVRVFGPNLSGPAQRKGEFHVHAEGCGDCKHYGPDGRFGGDDPDGWHMVVDTRAEVVEGIYEDQIHEGASFESCAATVWWAPCCNDIPEGQPTPAEGEEPPRYRVDVSLTLNVEGGPTVDEVADAFRQYLEGKIDIPHGVAGVEVVTLAGEPDAVEAKARRID